MAPRSVRVLFVDDEEDIVEAYAALLQMLFGWKVTPALSGKAALRILRKEGFDVIVSDYRMPQMSGVDFLRKAKQVAPQTPFIMLTAYGDPELEATSFGAGADRFLGKSESPQSIAASILEVLASAGSTSKAKGTRKPPRRSPPKDLPGQARHDVPPQAQLPFAPQPVWAPSFTPVEDGLLGSRFDLWG